LKNPDLDHRMEYFDPKTRPQAIFLDAESLLSAPAELMRSTATTVFASNIVAMSQIGHQSAGGGGAQPCVPAGVSRLSAAGR
jgi:alcohol dehydrogenase class IV